MRKNDYSLLKERALNNIEILFGIWKLDYVKIGPNEYDFLSPTRHDSSFGACRFNIVKGIGADFAGTSFKKSDFESVGAGFNKEDFTSFSRFGETTPNFDIIGLAQRIYNSDTYSEGATKLKEDLDKIDGGNVNTKQLIEQAAVREERAQVQKNKIKEIANRSWSYCRNIKNTIGEKYLNSRGIFMQDWDDEPNMKFNPKVFNRELNIYIPAVIFKVSNKPDGDLKAIHRIWIAADGSRKARLEENKKALGGIEGNGIWFGKPCDKLYVAEGPEEALTLRYGADFEFVVSTVYSTNYHSLEIPECVKTVVLVPDKDKAGETAKQKAIKTYLAQGKQVKLLRQ